MATRGAIGFAIEHDIRPVELLLELPAGPDGTAPSLMTILREGATTPFEAAGFLARRKWRYRLPVEPAEPGSADDELRFTVQYAVADELRRLTIVVRRTNCRIGTALVERRGDSPLSRQTRAALLWYAWEHKYRELCGLKRFTDGLSGSDVFVFRPRLADPPGHAELADPRWGSCLLVKSGPAASLGDEWQRYADHVAERRNPFMARNEALLDTRPADPGEEDHDRITLIGSFLGGELLQVESFGSLMRGTTDAGWSHKVVDTLAGVLATWHAGSSIQPLGEWDRIYGASGAGAIPTSDPPRLRRGFDGDWFDLASPPAAKLHLFGRYDLESDPDRRSYSGGVEWDVNFQSRDHLRDHMVGKGGQRDGLLYRLMALPVRFSLIHGDLHPRNLLVGRDDVWLLDFGQTGHGPTLYDFTKLEVYLRLWCLDLKPTSGDIDDAAARLEELLLDHMTGSQGSIEPVAELAEDLGARPDDLLKLARCVSRIRQRAVAAGTGCPDRRDYLAVLYLTVLETLQYGGREPELVENFRLLMALGWLLEDTLSRIVGRPPFHRSRAALDHRRLVTASWLAARGAPARVQYLLDREDGRRALAPLAATRGVLQNASHHLDVFDHTLLVMAYLEALLYADDRVAAFFDPGRLDREVEQALREQGVRLLPIPAGPAPSRADGVAPEGHLWEHARALIRGWLDQDTELALKWSVLFHDIGKPATRGSNTDGKKGPRIQFIKHELYGLQLVAGDGRKSGHLALYFPEAGRRARVADLILRHHAHHQWLNRYVTERPEVLAALEQSTDLGEIPLGELEYLAGFWEPVENPQRASFLDLQFHGYADLLASRGPEAQVPVTRIAAIDRAVLRSYALYMLTRDRLADGFDRLLGEVRATGLELRPGLSQRLRPWYLHVTAAREAAGKPPLTTAEFLTKAKQMNG